MNSKGVVFAVRHKLWSTKKTHIGQPGDNLVQPFRTTSGDRISAAISGCVARVEQPRDPRNRSTIGPNDLNLKTRRKQIKPFCNSNYLTWGRTITDRIVLHTLSYIDVTIAASTIKIVYGYDWWKRYDLHVHLIYTRARIGMIAAPRHIIPTRIPYQRVAFLRR
jgi:hypothetical protein